MTQINVCIANKQMHDKHKDQFVIMLDMSCKAVYLLVWEFEERVGCFLFVMFSGRCCSYVHPRSLISGFVVRCLDSIPQLAAKTCIMSYANNKGADQPEHPRSLIRAFVVRSLDSIIPLVSRSKISRF